MCVLQATEEVALSRRAITTVTQGGENPPSDTKTREVWSCGSPTAINLGAMEALNMHVTQVGFWTTLTCGGHHQERVGMPSALLLHCSLAESRDDVSVKSS
jgi:hypothetical protein